MTISTSLSNICFFFLKKKKGVTDDIINKANKYMSLNQGQQNSRQGKLYASSFVIDIYFSMHILEYMSLNWTRKGRQHTIDHKVQKYKEWVSKNGILFANALSSQASDL